MGDRLPAQQLPMWQTSAGYDTCAVEWHEGFGSQSSTDWNGLLRTRRIIRWSLVSFPTMAYRKVNSHPCRLGRSFRGVAMALSVTHSVYGQKAQTRVFEEKFKTDAIAARKKRTRYMTTNWWGPLSPARQPTGFDPRQNPAIRISATLRRGQHSPPVNRWGRDAFMPRAELTATSFTSWTVVCLA